MTENQVFDEIYNEYKNLVLRVAYMHVKDEHMANDVMQDTFLALYRDMSDRGIKSEEGYSNIKSWLYTTARRFALNYLKKSARMVLSDGLEESDAFDEPSTESAETECMEILKDEKRAELHERIFSALMEKNPRWYEAIMMISLLGIPQVEAAKRMGMTDNAFYVMIHRIRIWIEKKFGAEYEELKRL